MPYYIKDLKRDHNFDNHPCVLHILGFRVVGVSLCIHMYIHTNKGAGFKFRMCMSV